MTASEGSDPQRPDRGAPGATTVHDAGSGADPAEGSTAADGAAAGGVTVADDGSTAVTTRPNAYRRAVGWLRRLDALDVALTMTLLILLLHSPEMPSQLVRAVAAAALVIRPLARSPWFWLGVFWLRLVFQLPETWWSIDNHQYLITWWCLALGVGLLARDRLATIRLSARLLVGLCFAFATAWKVMSAEFVDGSFLQWTLITDGRFRPFAEAFLGLPEGAQAGNRGLLRELQQGETVTDALTTGAGVAPAAQLMTWWTIFIEGAVAVCFLWPGRRGPAAWRSVALLAFVLTIYPIAPVVGFAWVLIAMAIVTTDGRTPPWQRAALLATFAALPAFSWFDDIFARFT